MRKKRDKERTQYVYLVNKKKELEENIKHQVGDGCIIPPNTQSAIASYEEHNFRDTNFTAIMQFNINSVNDRLQRIAIASYEEHNFRDTNFTAIMQFNINSVNDRLQRIKFEHSLDMLQNPLADSFMDPIFDCKTIGIP